MPNAAHHAPPNPIENLNSPRVGGRVHALVRLRPSLAYLPPPALFALTCIQRHAPRHPPPRGQPLRNGRPRCERGVSPPVARALSISSDLISQQQSNARHHPRPYSTCMTGTVMGRRVHAVVMCGIRGSTQHILFVFVPSQDRRVSDAAHTTRFRTISLTNKSRPLQSFKKRRGPLRANTQVLLQYGG